MPYAHIEPFAIDKGLNTVVEELIAPMYIRRFYELEGKRIQKVEKNLGDFRQQRLYDLVDTFGVRWEVKTDKIGLTTGNAFIERQALEHSEADMYLIFCGVAYAVKKSALLEAIQNVPVKQGGDEGKATGYLLPLERLEEVAEQLIAL
jgi:hypothetical protein